MNYLKSGDEYLNTTTNLVLNAFGKNYSSITNHSKGVWYFEYSHKTGNNFYVIGYSSGSTEVTAIPSGEFPKLFAYSTEFTSLNNKTTNGKVKINLNITIEYNKHIGIGIDIDNHHIFYIYDNVLISFHFENPNQDWSVIAREALSEIPNCNDTVDIYFERKDFVYNPPFNALPWYSHIKLTCEINRQHLCNSFLLYAIFISRSF